MIGARRARVAAGAGLVAAAASVAAITPAQAAGVPGWRLVSARHFGPAGALSDLQSVVSAGRNAAWAFGSVEFSKPRPTMESPIAERWNGRSWQAAALPPGLAGGINAASAPRANDVWAVGNGFALHFNGSRWSVARRFTGPLGHPLDLTGVTAFSPANVWVFGPAGTFHLHGTTWTKVTGIAGNVLTASALSPSDMWAIGVNLATRQELVLHFNGSTWRQVTSKALNGAILVNILELSSRNVWAAGFPASSNPSTTGVLLHMQGTTWTRVKIPFPVFPVALARDGRGGIWTTAFGRSAFVALHRSGSGIWRRFGLPQSLFAPGLANIPGTASMWAAGVAFAAASPAPEAAIWAFGPV
jgi:hypothetical protein